MLKGMFNTLFPSTKKETKTMANSTQYVVYTRNFKSRAKQIGVFAEPASSYKVNGEVHGGKIKFKNLAEQECERTIHGTSFPQDAHQRAKGHR